MVLDADGATIAALRGDGAGIHTLDSAHDKAYTSTSFKNDTIALAEVSGIAALSKLPHVLFFAGGVVIKFGDEVMGAIGASGAPGAKLDDNCARAGLERISGPAEIGERRLRVCEAFATALLKREAHWRSDCCQ